MPSRVLTEIVVFIDVNRAVCIEQMFINWAEVVAAIRVSCV